MIHSSSSSAAYSVAGGIDTDTYTDGQKGKGKESNSNTDQQENYNDDENSLSLFFYLGMESSTDIGSLIPETARRLLGEGIKIIRVIEHTDGDPHNKGGEGEEKDGTRGEVIRIDVVGTSMKALEGANANTAITASSSSRSSEGEGATAEAEQSFVLSLTLRHRPPHTDRDISRDLSRERERNARKNGMSLTYVRIEYVNRSCD